MRTVVIATVLLLASSIGHAQQPVLWSAKQLADLEKKIGSNVDPARHLGAERLIEGGATLIYRDGNSEAEVHTKQDDFITIRSGEGEVLIGGTIIDGRATTDGELRGAGIKGATSYKVSAGDILYIPKNTVHQFVLAPGKHFIVTIVKITPSAPSATAAAAAPRAGNEPRNDLPQPYRTTRDWGELPAGMPISWLAARWPEGTGRLYRAVASRRTQIGRWLGQDSCAVDPSRFNSAR